MVRKHTKLFRLLPMVTVLVLIMAAGCAVKTKPTIWGDPASGLILTYRPAENQTLKYESSSKEEQTLEMMGQSMVNTTTGATSFSVLSTGLKENNPALKITLDDMKVEFKSMQGNAKPDLTPLKGKSFNMVISPLGKELEITGTEELTFKMGPQTRNVDTTFKTFFPDLPDKPVKVGDTWTSKDEISEKGKSMEVLVAVNNTSTLEGLETIDGMECVKIKTTSSGTMEGKGSQSGMQFTFDGTVKGTGIWYFAYKEGVYVKQTGENSSDGTIKLNNGMSIPMSSKGKSAVKLIK